MKLEKDSVAFRILERLRSSQDFVSSSDIAMEIGISKVAVFKRIKKLEKLGYKFETSKKGYRLVEEPDIPYPWELEPYDVVFFDEVSSTQDEAKKFVGNHGKVIIALRQRSGRGRMGRKWLSPEGNFYASVVLKWQGPLSDIVRVSMIGGLAVLNTVLKEVPSAKVKWPNDVWIDDNGMKKVAGVLAEFFASQDRINWIILGVGINVKADVGLDFATYLKKLSPSVELKTVAKRFLDEFFKLWSEFEKGRWLEIKSKIEENLLRGKMKVKTQKGEKEGEVMGLDEEGNLVIQLSTGEIETIFAGDVFPISVAQKIEKALS